MSAQQQQQQQQDKEAAADPGIQFVNMDIPSVLRHYQAWTGKQIVTDGALNAATVTILSSRPMADEEKALFVEKSLLLNGIALIPAGPNLIKALAVPGVGGQARSEGLEVFSNPDDLPDTDRLIAFVMRFEHLGAEAAAAALTSIFPSHGYGAIVPFPQAASVVITDNSATIRRYLELKTHLDVPREDVPLAIREFTLERADATKIVEALSELLALSSSAAGKSGPATQGSSSAPSGAGIYTQVASLGSNAARTLFESESPDHARVAPKIRADARTNKVLAVAEPKDMDYIRTLIGFLDKPATQRQFYRRKLNFLRVASLLDNLPNLLQPGLEGGGGAASAGSGAGTQARSSSSSQPSRQSSTSSSSRQGSRSSSGLSGFDFTDNPGPISLVIDKTFVLADPVQNRLLATGPEEHLRLLDQFISQLDRQPKQIQISSVIAQVSLGETLTTSIDLLRRLGNVDTNGLAGAVHGPSPILSATTLLGATSAANAAIGQGLTLYGKLSGSFDTALNAFQQLDQVKVLARPTVFTQNDRKAVIKTGERIAIPTSTYSPYTGGTTGIASSVSYEDVALQLEVLPLINSEEEITLNIIQVNDDIGKRPTTIGGNEIPSITTQELATTVVVANGGTVLLGGLIREEERTSQSGVPRLVALPLVGPLFGYTKHPAARSELLILIQPRIVEDAMDLAAAQADVQARANSSPEVMEFAAPPIRAEAEPVRKSLLGRLLKKRPQDPQGQLQPTLDPVQPAPVLNRVPRGSPEVCHSDHHRFATQASRSRNPGK